MHYFSGAYDRGGRAISDREMAMLAVAAAKKDRHIFIKQNFGLIFQSPRKNQLLSVPLFFESRDRNVTVIFEGRIHNADDLLADMGSYGRPDLSELIFLLYEHYDLEFLPLLEGAYSFVIWDRKKDKLVLHRDRIGIKPLYYHLKGDRLVFGTFINAILKHPSVRKEPDIRYLCNYFFMDGLSRGEETEYKDIKNLAPGQALIISRSGIKLKNADFRERFDLSGMGEDEIAQDLYSILQKSIKRQFIGEAANIAFSGGLDTKIIAALAKKYKKPINTFTAEFSSQSDTKRQDYSLARESAKRVGSRHLRYKLSPQLFLEGAEDRIKGTGRLLNFNNLNGFSIFEWVSRYSDSVISGDGTEEQLSLYEYHMLPYYADNLIGKLSSIGVKRIHQIILDSYCDLFLMRSWEAPQGLEPGTDIDLFKKRLFIGATRQEAIRNDTRKVFYDCWDVSPDTNFLSKKKTALPSLFNKALFVDFMNNLCPKLLTAYDLVSRTNSIEVCLPFFDADFVSFASKIPASLKLPPASLKYKYILRRAVAGLIGEKEAFSFFKSGSDIPFEEWLVESCFEKYAKEKLAFSKLKKGGILNEKYVSQILHEHYANKRLFRFLRPDGTTARMLKEGNNHTHKILKLLGFQLWWEENF